MSAFRFLPPASVDDARADLALARAAHDFAMEWASTIDELEHAFELERIAALRLEALISQCPVRHMKAWA